MSTQHPEPTSACVLVFHPQTGLVLVERGPKGTRPPGLPGGKREPSDLDSLRTAQRELLEETGVGLRSASSIIVYEIPAGPEPDGRSFVCEAFLAVDVDRYPSELEAAALGCSWVDAEVLVLPGSRFPEYCARLFARLAQMRARPWPIEVRRCA